MSMLVGSRGKWWCAAVTAATALALVAVLTHAATTDEPVGEARPPRPPGHVTLPVGSVRVTAGPSADSEVLSTYTPGAPIDVIVRFDAPALGRRARGPGEVHAARVPYQRFLADLPGLEASASSRSRSARSSVRRRLEASFNGVALTGSRELVQRIRSLPYVLAVYPDDTVRAQLAESVPLIRADTLRAATGASGQGIVVSIIDTGIDYTHPALGGCFGPGCRVVAGYDFVNSDADPSDDNEHGTHVAGIVGANGAGLVGVAPAVLFHAYKVLGEFGSGTTSNVIAGIDRSLDPDQDPLTDDAVDVINLSLGGTGDADSPLSLAVDAAVQAGVVCAVAAGNAGGYNRFFRLGTPASSRLAITVGSSTKNDTVSSFSSSGPGLPDYDLKPEVVAPGSAIVSSVPGGGTASFNGTSMATPHVAGVAALLLELHPEWTPGTIKNRLMNTARDLGAGPYRNGAGRIDALKAASSGLMASPGSLAFGIASAAAPFWSRTDTLRLTNTSTSQQTVTFATSSTLPAGSYVSFSPPGLALNPGQAADLLVTLVLDNAPNLDTPPHAYTGRITARTGSDTVSVPFSVQKAPKLSVRFSGEIPWLAQIHDRSTLSRSRQVWDSVAEFVVPSGVYDVIVQFGDLSNFVVREGISVSDSVEVGISEADAIYEIRREGRDVNGNTITPENGITYFLHSSNNGVIIFGTFAQVSHFSPVSSAYVLQWQASGTSPGSASTHIINGYVQGIQQSQTFTNAPGDLLHVRCAFYSPEEIPAVTPLLRMTDFAFYSSSMSGFPTPYYTDVYFQPLANPASTFRTWDFELYPAMTPFDPDAQNPIFITPYMGGEAGGPVRGFALGDKTNPIVSLPSGSTLHVAYGPPTWFGKFDNLTDRLLLLSSRGFSHWRFRTQQGSWSDHFGVPYAIRREGVLVESGQYPYGFHQDGSAGFVTLLTPGAHTFEMTNDRYRIAGANGVAQVSCSFNTLFADKNPPFMTELSILAQGEVADTFVDVATVRFKLLDDVGVASVALSYRVAGAGAWTPLEVGTTPDGYEAALPPVVGYVSLRIEASDAAGNTLSYEMNPAVRGPSGPVAVGDPEGHAAPAPALVLEGAAPNPSRDGLTVRFGLPDTRPVLIEVIDLAGRRVASRRVSPQEPGAQTLSFASQGWRPGIYWLRLVHPDRTLARKACLIR